MGAEETFVAEYKDEPKKPEGKVDEPTLEIKQEEEKPATDPYVEKAAEQGWKPQDEWEGDPSDWRDAKEFVERGELFDKISNLNKHSKFQEKRLADMEKALKTLGEHNKKIAKLEHDKAMARLKAQKADAFEDNDGAALVEIDEKLETLKEEGKALEEEVVETTAATKETPAAIDPNDPSTYPEQIVTWLENPANKWYLDNAGARGAMNAFAEEFSSQHTVPGEEPDYDKLIKYAEKKVKESMPHLFTNDQRGRASVSEPSNVGVRPKAKSKYSTSDLSDEQRRVMREFVRSDIMSEDEYISQLVEIGELQ